MFLSVRGEGNASSLNIVDSPKPDDTDSPKPDDIPKPCYSPTDSTASTFLYYGGFAFVGTGVAVATPFVILPALGFGSAGIVAGSVAATYQASVGSVAAGSLFATLQSAGAGGLAWTTTAAFGAAGGVATTGGAAVVACAVG